MMGEQKERYAKNEEASNDLIRAKRCMGQRGCLRSLRGRWSRLVARKFLRWLAVPANARWLDVGCGTGALTQTILEVAAPLEVLGVDAAEAFLAFARRQIHDPRANALTGEDCPGNSFAVSNFALHPVAISCLHEI